LFCLSHWGLPNHGSLLVLLESLDMHGCIKLVSWCFDQWWKSIEYWTNLKIHL
jgi:hypothetical protein